jgi:hypothetical protein
MFIENGKYLPDIILMEGKFVSWKDLTFQQMRTVRKHGKQVKQVEHKPLLKHIIENSTLVIMKYGGGFTGKEFNEISDRAHVKGYNVQWLLREAHGGGRGARAWGYIYYHKDNLLQKYFEEHNIWDEFQKIPKAKQINRIQKFLGQQKSFSVKPRIKIVDEEFNPEGLIFATPSFMDKCGIAFGSKTTGAAKSLIVPAMEDNTEWDIVVPSNENKIKLDAEKLADNMYLNPTITPFLTFSRNLKKDNSEDVGRNPQMGLDLSSMLNKLPRPEWLELPKRIFEGKATSEEIVDNLFSYTDDNTGEKMYREAGKAVLTGRSLFDKDIWEEGKKPLMTLIMNCLQPRIKGIYGIVMPKSFLNEYNAEPERIRGWITRFPWTLPILATAYVWKDCIFIDEELLKLFGGDCDGDQVAIFDQKAINGHFIWERDKEWLESKMRLPEKVDAKDSDWTMERQISIVLDQLAGCGTVFNSSKIVVDSARKMGMDLKHLLGMEIELQSTMVQPFIDGLKYEHCTKVPTVFDMARIYKVEAQVVIDVGRYFNALRGRKANIDDIVTLAQSADFKSRSYYERVIAMFKGWKKNIGFLEKKLHEGVYVN